MASMRDRAIAGAASRIPGVRRIPVVRLLFLAEVAMMARQHLMRLEPAERRRLAELVRRGRGRSSNLPPDEADELRELVARLEPRVLAGETLLRVSPVPLPRRMVVGSRRGRTGPR
jgi:hypothetical protein